MIPFRRLLRDFPVKAVSGRWQLLVGCPPILAEENSAQRTGNDSMIFSISKSGKSNENLAGSFGDRRIPSGQLIAQTKSGVTE